MKHHIGKLVARIHEASHKWFVRELAAAGLESLAPSHGDVLAYLFEHETGTMAELAGFAHRTRPTMTVLVDKMEALGLVQRKRSKEDTRNHVVSLTKRGRALRPAFEDISARFASLVCDGFSGEEADEAERMLSRILSNAEKGTTK